eukprot:scaffold609_cov234-Pinguiococcus_pyrenoidosus.AAC.15
MDVLELFSWTLLENWGKQSGHARVSRFCELQKQRSVAQRAECRKEEDCTRGAAERLPLPRNQLERGDTGEVVRNTAEAFSLQPSTRFSIEVQHAIRRRKRSARNYASDTRTLRYSTHAPATSIDTWPERTIDLVPAKQRQDEKRIGTDGISPKRRKA